MAATESSKCKLAYIVEEKAEGPLGLSSCWPALILKSLVCPEGSQTSLLPYKKYRY